MCTLLAAFAFAGKKFLCMMMIMWCQLHLDCQTPKCTPWFKFREESGRGHLTDKLGLQIYLLSTSVFPYKIAIDIYYVDCITCTIWIVYPPLVWYPDRTLTLALHWENENINYHICQSQSSIMIASKDQDTTCSWCSVGY